jgi:hypothetical protein
MHAEDGFVMLHVHNNNITSVATGPLKERLVILLMSLDRQAEVPVDGSLNASFFMRYAHISHMQQPC